MLCFQRLATVKAISFDLDDTLYNNQPIIHAAEAAMQQWLLKQYPRASQWGLADWRQCKLQQFALNPALQHDTTAARKAMLFAGLMTLGYSHAEAEVGAEQGLAYFYDCRSDFRVSDAIIELLMQLKQRYRLIGITNGNVDHQRIGLGEALEWVLHPGNGVRMKPYPDMFLQAQSALGLPLSQLLHVGDHPITDVEGARRAGAQAVWLAPAFEQATLRPLGRLLPHWRISHPTELALLLS
ncbi:HAD-IA family hydrolase [Shewanella avicenniae]|uniref:HAD-IA family hydrolase n=1 Tax=Shewanella avicenniae TaxID=2814294 RepID=A0ABX7QRI1_9GAMM|nr:HAD-IA family hydrolase [Shewanella avicenniae]QSX34068.1 HAD-IA family hydrolase [Shewanella avicenniae]